MSQTTPPPLQGPTAKEKKYDRQLRLWAASGQAALEDARILLINGGCGAVGTEILKNLILPGIGQFTIFDPATVQEADLGVNFFLDESSIGRSRAVETVKHLQELNPDVRGYAIQEGMQDFLSRVENLSPYTFIVFVGPVARPVLEMVSRYAGTSSVPLVYVHSLGFYGHMSIQVAREFPIVDTHPDPATTSDLRLVKPWPELIEFARKKTADLETMENDEHGHVPSLLLIMHYLDEWAGTHQGRLPSSFKEKNEVKALIKAGMRMNIPEGGEENFEQAVAAATRNLNAPNIRSAVQEVLGEADTRTLTAESDNFWIIAKAVSDFYRLHQVLPLPGSVPDMKAKSSDYIELQNIYKTKARQDVDQVLFLVRRMEAELGRARRIEEKEVEAFCKGAGYIRLIRGSPLLMTNADGVEEIRLGRASLGDYLHDETCLYPLYISFCAFDKFISRYGHVPGEGVPANSTDDNVRMASIGRELFQFALRDLDIDIEDVDRSRVGAAIDDYCTELTRAAGGELHNISAVVGGLAAQEAIKIITKQYVPCDNACLFDGIKSTTSVLKL